MKEYTRLYLKSLGYDEEDFIRCEIHGCEARAVDIHHIHRRGMGGCSSKYTIQDIMALCRIHHDKYGDRKQYIDFLKSCHEHRLIERGVNIGR